MEVSGRWRMTASPADVWDVLVDLTAWPRWWPAVDQVEVVEAGTGRIPERVALVFDPPAPLRSLRIPVRVAQVDPPWRLAVEADGSGFAGDAALEVRTDPDGATVVPYRFAFRTTRPWLKPVDAILATAMRGAGDQRLERAGADLAALAGGHAA